jgi:hypothetical protein
MNATTSGMQQNGDTPMVRRAFNWGDFVLGLVVGAILL